MGDRGPAKRYKMSLLAHPNLPMRYRQDIHIIVCQGNEEVKMWQAHKDPYIHTL